MPWQTVTGRERVLVGQLGARMHYAVPETLHDAGLLYLLCTDFLAPRGGTARTLLELAATHFGTARRILGRRPKRIPSERLSSFPAFGLWYAVRLRMSRRRSREGATHLWAGREFCKLLLNKGLGNASVVYLFNSAALEVFKFAKQSGILCVLEQTIAPMRAEVRILAGEHLRFPGWEVENDQRDDCLEIAIREEREWQLADMILCGSEFVRGEIASCGGPVDRSRVIPYGYDLPDRHLPTNRRRGSSGRVKQILFVGSVGLRKGIGYLVEAMKLLGRTGFHAVAVGPTTLSIKGIKAVSEWVTLTGALPRSDVSRFYRESDMLVLPSMCEGSATVSYEALASGLPVITTPNAGTVVRDGVEGFIIPSGDAHALADRIERLAGDESLRIQMSENARRRAEEFTVAKYGYRLVEALIQLRRELGTSCVS